MFDIIIMISFTCERCGKRFHLDEHLGGRRGRCSQCGLVMRIPAPAAGDPPSPEPEATAEPEISLVPAEEPASAPERAPFRLSPLELRPHQRPENPQSLPAAL